MINKSARVSAVLVAGLMGFGGFAAPLCHNMVAPMTAFAAEGSVTISQQHNTGATYDGYRIFKADVDASGNASNITWESDTMKANVLAYLDTCGYGNWLTASGHVDSAGGVTPHDNAQNAADFIAEKIRDSTVDAQANTTPSTTKGDSFANGLARDLATKGVAKVTQNLASGTAYTGDQGYYLFVTHSDTIGVDEAGTAPIWVAVGATAQTITEKSAIPTVRKEVKEDSGTEYGSVADAHRGQALDYRLTGTVAANANAYETYFYEFVDTMGGLAMDNTDVANVVVKIDDTDVTNTLKAQKGSSIAYNDGTLTVTIANLMGLGTLNANSKVTVDYHAHLSADAAIGQAGNSNTVVLNYSSDPAMKTKHSSTSPSTSKTYAYALELKKVDQSTREVLGNAEFTIQVADASTDASSKGKYVQADGSLSSTAYTFKTGASGTFAVQGIDEGVYTIRETKAPAGHKTLAADMTLTLGRTFDSTGALTGLTAEVTGGNGLFVTSPQEGQDGITGASTSKGEVDLTVSNKRETYLPGTGMTTSSAGIVAGFILLTGGLVGISRHRKGDMDDAA